MVARDRDFTGSDMERGIFKTGGCIPEKCAVYVIDNTYTNGHVSVYHETRDGARRAAHGFHVPVDAADYRVAAQQLVKAIREHFPVEHFTVFQRGLSD